MSIQELSQKFKGFVFNEDILIAGLIIVVSLSSFYLGKVSNSVVQPQVAEISSGVSKIEQASLVSTTSASGIANTNNGGYVASKSGTKYHLPWCPGAKQMNESNKIYFATKEDAEKAGYSPAANCKGI